MSEVRIKMLQMRIRPEDREELLKLAPQVVRDNNTLYDTQRAHHITMIYNATESDVAKYRELFPGVGMGLFQPHAVYASDDIAAVFGNVFTYEGNLVKQDMHITLAGCVDPYKAADLMEEGVKIHEFSVAMDPELRVDFHIAHSCKCTMDLTKRYFFFGYDEGNPAGGLENLLYTGDDLENDVSILFDQLTEPDWATKKLYHIYDHYELWDMHSSKMLRIFHRQEVHHG